MYIYISYHIIHINILSISISLFIVFIVFNPKKTRNRATPTFLPWLLLSVQVSLQCWKPDMQSSGPVTEDR